MSNQQFTFTVPLQIKIALGSPGSEASVSRMENDLVTAEGSSGEGGLPSELLGRFSKPSLTANGFSWKTSLSLALASYVTYQPAETVRDTVLNRWRMETCVVIEASSLVCFVASSADAVVVAFRGTNNARNWLANLDLRSTDQSYGTVHKGFYLAYQILEARILEVLAALGNRRVLLTGHSLGGALATVAAAELLGEDIPVSGVYTYGQPALGKKNFRTFMKDRYEGKFHRTVNDDDIVPQVPPNFHHVGKLFHLGPDGDLLAFNELATAPEVTTTEADEPDVMSEPEFQQLQQQLREAGDPTGPTPEARESMSFQEGFFPSFSDHSMELYVTRVARFA